MAVPIGCARHPAGTRRRRAIDGRRYTHNRCTRNRKTTVAAAAAASPAVAAAAAYAPVGSTAAVNAGGAAAHAAGAAAHGNDVTAAAAAAAAAVAAPVTAAADTALLLLRRLRYCKWGSHVTSITTQEVRLRCFLLNGGANQIQKGLHTYSILSYLRL